MSNKHQVVVLALGLVVGISFGAKPPPEIFKNVGDYGFMWWENGLLNNPGLALSIKTSRYALSLDYATLQLKSLSILSNPRLESEVLRETESQSFPVYSPVAFGAVIEAGGNRYPAIGSSGVIADCHLSESGKFFQRRIIRKIRYAAGAPGMDTTNTGLEIASWPDRFSFIMRVQPTMTVNQGALEMSFDLDNVYSSLLQSGTARALSAANGSGFVFLPVAGTVLTVDAANARVTARRAPANWTAGVQQTMGFIVYPVSSDLATGLDRAVETETSPLAISAQQLQPSTATLAVAYNPEYGWHQIGVRNDGSGADRFDRTRITITNTASHERVARINFEKLTTGAIVGISMVLRDEDGNPMGVPVQLSKNWHITPAWFRGFTLVTVPANATVNFEMVSVNSNWGRVFAASHAQLSLIGWGSNQQWDESAIGAGGESITYSPDRGTADAFLCDFRGISLGSLSGWTGNVGGADFFRHYNTAGQIVLQKRMRTQYRRICPNMTEVTFAHTNVENTMDQEYSATIYRTNDITRGLYRIRMDVRANTGFRDFVFFQAASERYHTGGVNRMAFGNETGLVQEWTPTPGGNIYRGIKLVATGRVPWFSLHDALPDPLNPTMITGNRGFVIRSWNARINGVDNVPPSWAEYGTNQGFGGNGSIINITPPAGVTSFQTGDYVDALIELFIVPKTAADYAGTNANLRSALQQYQNTWTMAHREAMGNDLGLVMTTGQLENTYPIRVRANAVNAAQFRVTGGLGYVPVTITGLTGYRDPLLQENVNGVWQTVDQTNFGKDFWQADYYLGNWEITYSLNLDSPNDVRTTREFRFSTSDVSTAVKPSKRIRNADLLLKKAYDVKGRTVKPTPASKAKL